MQPLINKVIIKKHEPDTISGLAVVGGSDIKPSIGTVIASGSGTKSHPANYKPNDVIAYTPNTEMYVTVGEEKFTIVLNENIIYKL